MTVAIDEQPLALVCAWCKITLRDGDWQHVSHGVCIPCRDKLLAERGKS